MKATSLLTSLALGLISTAAFSNCTQNCGYSYGGMHTFPDNRTPADFEQLCYSNMMAAGGQALASKLSGDKALNAAARNTAAATEQKIKDSSSCAGTCKKYGQDRYDWAFVQTISSTPVPGFQHFELFYKWKGKSEPSLPGASEFNACYAPAKHSNWCPGSAQSGPVADIGNGPVRLPNHLDGIEVCAQEMAGFTLLSFSPEEIARKACARPQIVDALLRYKEERKCLDTKTARPDLKQAGALNPVVSPVKP